jgi:hypothetical protein
MLILACDPGLSGAIAVLGPDWCKVADLPTVPMEGEGTIKRRVHGPGLQALILENVPPGEEDIHFVVEALSTGGQNNMVQTSISQGRTRGAIEAVAECMGLQVNEVYARTWKRLYGLSGKAAEGNNEAARAREIAAQLYPAVGLQLQRACDHNRAEAILIGNWYRKAKL